MEPLLAMQTAAVLIAIGALGGLVMAGVRLKGAERPPSSLAMAHGLMAGAALTLLIYSWLTVGLPQFAQWATGVLVLAALGGAYINLRYHSKMLPLPVPLIVGHAMIAATGFILLLLALI